MVPDRNLRATSDGLRVNPQPVEIAVRPQGLGKFRATATDFAATLGPPQNRQSAQDWTYDPMLHGSARHADRILDVVARGARDPTSDVVVHSWARCVNEYRLDPNQPRQPPMLDPRRTADRNERMADVIDCARYEMTTLYQQLGDPESAVRADRYRRRRSCTWCQSPEFERGAAPLGLQLGAVWSEAEAGTNGMGTCVAAAGAGGGPARRPFLHPVTHR